MGGPPTLADALHCPELAEDVGLPLRERWIGAEEPGSVRVALLAVPLTLNSWKVGEDVGRPPRERWTGAEESGSGRVDLLAVPLTLKLLDGGNPLGLDREGSGVARGRVARPGGTTGAESEAGVQREQQGI
ncbi:hypothetical protein NDU88_004037 [Pleurodeles waltl]|uniref:Uncharacterized protein n=1 Tax=Pleurodeles waltl TaxID=8319 RepID=A0AAV7MFG0_PLEWA|nr:hypothetical protein NDU88_004037 [Pleurodeles waltl]